MTSTDSYSTDTNAFDHILPSQSAQIYRELLAGKVIVREYYDRSKSQLTPNPLYNVLYNHMKHFQTLYEHLGFDLVFSSQGAFFYLREPADDDQEEHDENAFKVQVALLVIGRYFARSGRELEYLGRPDAGLREDDINTLNADEQYRDLLHAARFTKGFQEALEYLERRYFAFRSSARSVFLSSAGMCFLETLVSGYERYYE